MIQATRKNNLTIQVQSRNHSHVLLSDVGVDQGGDDLGMSPHELLESALGACTSMTVQMYAMRKGWPLESCDSLVTIQREGAETLIEVKINLVGPNLDEEQRARLLDIAGKCPVHKILIHPTKINISV